MLQQRATVMQSGQIVMVGQIAKPRLGGDASLHLGEECSDGHEGVKLGLVPFPITELDEPQQSSGDLARYQRHGGSRRYRNPAGFFDEALIVLGGRLGPEHERLLACSHSANTGSASAK